MEGITQVKQFIIGIDPGKNGGIVGLTNGHINLITKMPQTPSEMWGYLESSGLHLLLKSKENNTHVYIEDVHSMPRDGVRSAFTFGRQLGILDTILAYYPVAVTRVIPHKWMAFLGLQKENEESKYNYKKRLVEKARSLAFVIDRDKLSLATADAFLIAYYGERVSES
jgi:crossover junction endodeoxyribonuclease RuvC